MRLLPGKTVLTREGKPVKQEDIFECIYNDSITEINGWTLRDLMEYIRPHSNVLGEIAWCNFEAFYEEMNRPFDTISDFAKKIKWLEVSRVAEIFDDTNEVSEYINVTGYDFEGERYSFGMTAMNEIAHLPIRINDVYELRKAYSGPDVAPIFSGKKGINLFELIYGILYEISFYGSPEKRDDFNEEIAQRSEEIDNGTVVTYTMEEVKKQLDAHFEYIVDFTGPCGAD